ncbi:MAG: DUF4838 domain-containing protein [Porticoccaceae bacterium]|nr:DUF4838 domain-containing protein [Porticoccaceae bacterium]
MKTRHILSAIFILLSAALFSYDLRNPALTPVQFAPTDSHAPIKLVENGKLNFAIVYDFGIVLDRRELDAATFVLQDAFEKCVGTAPEVLTFSAKDQEKAGRYPYLIYVGNNKVAAEKGLEGKNLPEQGYVIKSFADALFITGYDSSTVKVDEAASDLGPMQGSVWGAIDFTERILGCRYYFPHEYGSIYPKITNLAIQPLAYSDAPYMLNRDSCWIAWSFNQRRKKMWDAYLGEPIRRKFDTQHFGLLWRLSGSLANPHPFHPGHDPEPRFLVRHFPERINDIFFTNAAGYMYYNPKQHIGNDMDFTNLKLADLIIDCLKKYYASNGKELADIWEYKPNRRYINIGQCDGEVPLADMLQNETVKRLKLISEEDIASGVALRNVYGRFLQYFANQVKKEFPDLRVAFLPYQGGTYPPTDPRWKLPDNIDIRMATHCFPRYPQNPQKTAKTLDAMRDWYEALGKRQIASLWFYHIPASSGSAFIRAICSQNVGESIKVCGEYLGRTNIFYDQYGGLDWSYYYSEYAGARCFWNPDFNVDAAIEEHWVPFYGEKAGEALRKAHRILKDGYMKYYVLPENATYNPLFSPQDVNGIEALLKEAREAVSPDSVEGKRVALFCRNFDAEIVAQRSRQGYVRPLAKVYRMLEREQCLVDGLGDEAFWRKAKSVPLIDGTGGNAESKYPVDLRLAWNDEGIYGLALASDTAVAKEAFSMWKNDSYEFFFSPGSSKSEYFQYVIDSIGQTMVGQCTLLPVATPFNKQWDKAGFKCAVKNNGEQGWSLEFFVAFDNMRSKMPKAYDQWYFNAVRNKMTEKGDSLESRSSSMTLGINKNLEMFGNIKFLGKGD